MRWGGKKVCWWWLRAGRRRRRRRDVVPLLDLVEAGEERDGDEDDDCLFAVADFELYINCQSVINFV